jgi:N utilization substance protein B
MLNRRHLRIKVLQALYAWSQSSERSIVRSEKDFLKSLKRIEELYVLLLLYIVELRDFANNHIQDSKHKKLPSENDLSPNTKFVDNEFLAQLVDETRLMIKASDFKLSFSGKHEMIRNVFFKISKSEDYINYMSNPDRSYEEDKKIVLKIFSKQMVDVELFQDYLRDEDIFWEDDLPFITSMITKTIKDSTSDGIILLSLFKDKDEESFAMNLFRKAITNSDRFSKLISEKVKNWEIDRVAQMDLILMQMALTELIEMPTVPIKVSMNEYIDLAKYYSTERSKKFVNGILDTLVSELIKEGTIKKTGRGLIE